MDATQRIYEGKRSGWFSRRRAKAATAEVWEVSRQVDDGHARNARCSPRTAQHRETAEDRLGPEALPARKPRNA